MDKLTTARVYFLFALLLCGIVWQISQTAAHEIVKIQLEQAAQIDRALGASE